MIFQILDFLFEQKNFFVASCGITMRLLLCHSLVRSVRY